MATFEIGKKYFDTSVCDHNCVFVIEIVKRTDKTVTYIRNGEQRRAKLFFDRDGEYIIPERYSMAPVFRATREYRTEEPSAPEVTEAPAESNALVDGIKVTRRAGNYIDFVVSSDSQNLYRYESFTGKMRKLFGVGPSNYGHAIRGNERVRVESLARLAFENNLPFCISISSGVLSAK